MDTSASRRSGSTRWLAGPALIAVVAVTLLIGGMAKGSTPAQAATGDQLRQITADLPPCSVGTGIAFDGTHLIKSCWGSNVLGRVSPADGSFIDSLTIAGVTDIGAMAWDGSRSKLWVCDSGSQVYLVDTGALTSTFEFATGGCVDGLAYDGTDDTIWASADASSTLRHYDNAGTLLGTFDLSGKLGNCGNSGIAVGGDKLYLANNGCSEIYQCTKDLATCTLMSSFPRRIEDLECDNITFAPKGAVWSVDAYDHVLNAWEIPAGTCNLGGGVGSNPTAVPHTAVPTPCIGGIVSSRCPGNPPEVKVTVTATPEATVTSAPPTQAPPTVAAPQPTATPPGGGAAGVIIGPNTGSGPGDGGASAGWVVIAAALLAAGVGVTGAAIGTRPR